MSNFTFIVTIISNPPCLSGTDFTPTKEAQNWSLKRCYQCHGRPLVIQSQANHREGIGGDISQLKKRKALDNY